VTSNVIEQPAGREWRQFHEVWLRWIGAIAILGAVVGLVGFYLWRGMVRIEKGRSGRTVVRFNAFERFIHWMTATCFIILAISGLNITFGKPLLLPLMSPEAFTTWSQALKYAHNFLSFPFTIGVVVIFLMWVAGNLPNKVDVEWLKEGGGILDPKKHPPAYRFNAGQKMIYWIVVLGGTASAITGYVLMFPFFGGLGIAGMQTAQIVHGIVAMLFVAAMLGHIYIGTIGMEGAFEAMGTGEVDINWAREHHRLWLEEETARTGPNQSKRQPAATPAE
jgi:formate dehydrogenase subunit gamma